MAFGCRRTVVKMVGGQHLDKLPERMDISPPTIEQPHMDVDIKNPDSGKDVADSSDSERDLIIDFTKLVLKQYPNSTTADLCRNCFEDMRDLHWRKRGIIDGILIKAGAKKSRRGKQAIKIEWKDKYPKAQWMRVFENKK